MNTGRIPYLRIVVAVSVFVLAGFAAVSAYVLAYTDDEITKGNIIGTWQNFAMLAVGFWIGSSSGGKSQSNSPSGTQADPLVIEGAPRGEAVTTTTKGKSDG